MMNSNGVKESYLGPKPLEGQRLDGDDHMAHYHGDFRKRSEHVH